jgi:hypothetical protein
MRTLVLSLVAGAAMAVATGASATSFVGSTGGCFGAACSPTSTATLPGTGLSFTTGIFGVQDSNGFAGIGTGLGNPNTLGSFTLLPTQGTTALDNVPFTLLVNFTSPGSLSGNYFGTIFGSVTDSNAGGIQVDLDNTAHTFGTGAAAFTLTVNDVAVSNDGVATPITGFIRTAVPEPTTWAMMLLGFAGIGFAMRRRRSPALAQIA